MSQIGRPLPRREDIRLIRGQARYLDDIDLPRMQYLGVVRSTAPHAIIAGISGADVAGADLPARVNRLPVLYRHGSVRLTDYPVLPVDRVHYVGQPVACCLGDSPYTAEDRASRVTVAYKPLPAVASVADALTDGVLLYPNLGTNVVAHLAIQSGPHAVSSQTKSLSLSLGFGRSQAVPMEGRGVAADWDAGTQRLTVWSSTQAPNQLQSELARLFELGDTQVHVITPDVGGAFGNKLHIFPEDILACYLAMRSGRPVKWVEDRTEYFVGNVHSRDVHGDFRIFYDDSGRIERLEGRLLVDAGAHPHTKGIGPAAITARSMGGGYTIGSLDLTLDAVVTNKTPNGAYRGFGQPEAAFFLERIMDAVARETGLSAIEVRQRNLVADHAFPYINAAGARLDSGQYRRALQECHDRFDFPDFRRRQAVARQSGRHLGAGIGFYVESTGSGPSSRLGMAGQNQGGYERVDMKVLPSGHVAVHLGVVDQGQGHATTFAQIAAEALGIEPERVRTFAGDTDRDPYSGYGTASSRSVVVAGTAVMQAGEELSAKLRHLAAFFLEAAPDDIAGQNGRYGVVGSDRSLTLAELAQAAYTAHHLPKSLQSGLVATAVYDPTEWAYSYGASAAEVEVDPRTGLVRVLRYLMVHDAGVVVNPRLAEAQLTGGIIQGIGGALLEETVYDSGGQPVTTTFKDYLLPSILEVPEMSLHHLSTPSPVTPMGMKGLAEGGVVAPAPVIVQAIEDALGISGLAHVPVTPAGILKHLGDFHHPYRRSS